MITVVASEHYIWCHDDFNDKTRAITHIQMKLNFHLATFCTVHSHYKKAVK